MPDFAHPVVSSQRAEHVRSHRKLCEVGVGGSSQGDRRIHRPARWRWRWRLTIWPRFGRAGVVIAGDAVERAQPWPWQGR
jgi:hypothetical protein